MPPSLFDFPFSWSVSIRPSQGRLILFGWELFAELCAMDSSRMETSPEDYSAPPHPDCCAPTPPTPRLAFPIPPPATAPVGGPAAATDRADCSAPLHPGTCKFSCFVSLCFVLMCQLAMVSCRRRAASNCCAGLGLPSAAASRCSTTLWTTARHLQNGHRTQFRRGSRGRHRLSGRCHHDCRRWSPG